MKKNESSGLKDKAQVKDSRRRGFFWASNEIFSWGEEIGPQGLAAYLCLCRHADSDKKSHPSLNQMARECGMSRSTVIRTIQRLGDLGLIVILPQRTATGEPKANIYELVDLPDKPSQKDDEVAQKKSGPSVPLTPPPSVTQTLGSSTQTLGSVPLTPPPSVTQTPMGNPLMGNPYGKPMGESADAQPTPRKNGMPECVPQAEWDAYVQARELNGNPLSIPAILACWQELVSANAAGFDPGAMLRRATMGNGLRTFDRCRETKKPDSGQGQAQAKPKPAFMVGVI